MTNTLIHTEHLDNDMTVEIHRDLDPQHPRKDWDTTDTMVLLHRRYDFPNEAGLREGDFDGWESMKRHIVEELGAVAILPVYGYDHGSITISTGEFGDRWDSGMLGFVFFTREQVKEHYPSWKVITKSRREHLESVLKSSVKVYDDYLNGNVYGYVTKDAEDEEVDSCWGFYPDDDHSPDYNYALKEGISAANAHAEWLKEQDTLIDNIMAL